MFTKEIINEYANKLIFDLTDEEANELLEEFDAINRSMEMIDNIPNLDKIEPLHFPQDSIVSNNLRQDNESGNILTKDALKNCGDVLEDVAVVPKVVG